MAEEEKYQKRLQVIENLVKDISPRLNKVLNRQDKINIIDTSTQIVKENLEIIKDLLKDDLDQEN